MTKKTDTLATLLELIHDQHHLDVTGVTPATGLAQIGLDSLAVAELLFSIEDAFNITLEDVDPADIPVTVGEVVALIDEQLGKA